MRIAVEAHPGAKMERVALSGDTLHVWVRAKPVEGRANAAIEHLIARALNLRTREVHIINGAASRHKTIDLALPTLAALRAKLSNDAS